MDFSYVIGTSKEEKLRAWAIEKAIEMGTPSDGKMTSDVIVNRAINIEKYVKEGKSS